MPREVSSRDPFFSEGGFCLGVILGLFVEDRLVICLSGRFRSPRIPLGISVEDRVLEIMSLDSRLGLILGDFYLGTGKPIQI